MDLGTLRQMGMVTISRELMGSPVWQIPSAEAETILQDCEPQAQWGWRGLLESGRH